MRFVGLACGVGALALAGLVYASHPADAAKTKMGCERGKQVWDAGAGKCVSGRSKYAGMTAKAGKKAAKKAPAAKKK